MSLNEEQLKSVAAWFAGGASLDEIQKRLVAEFGVHLTYFDLRMKMAAPQRTARSASAPYQGRTQRARRPLPRTNRKRRTRRSAFLPRSP